jgi:hypothetical protein
MLQNDLCDKNLIRGDIETLLVQTPGAARNHQRGSRNPRPPDAIAFWRRYPA